jgi:hypothetical protein
LIPLAIRDEKMDSPLIPQKDSLNQKKFAGSFSQLIIIGCFSILLTFIGFKVNELKAFAMTFCQKQ